MASRDLGQWLERTEQRQADLVEALGISRQLASLYVVGRRVPSYEIAQLLEELTKGAVRVKDWRLPADVPSEEAPPRPPTTTERQVKIAKLRERARRLPR